MLANVHNHFDDCPGQKVKCKHCGKLQTKNGTRQRQHLENCDSYAGHELQNQLRSSIPPASPGPSSNSPGLSSTFLSLNDEDAPSSSAPSSLGPRFSGISKVQRKPSANDLRQQKERRDRALANLFYGACLPFNLVESPEFRAFVRSLSTSYNPPSRAKLSGDMLDGTYQNVKDQVFGVLGRSRHLHLTLDESANVNHDRVINLSCRTEGHAFYLYTKVAVLGQTLSAEALKAWLEESVTAIGSEYYRYIPTYPSEKFPHDNDKKLQIVPQLTLKIVSGRVTSLATDTNSTMRKLWRLMLEDPAHQTNKIICIGCDSHGIQLLIKDILQLPEFRSTFKEASAVVSTIRNSPKLLSEFRRIQQRMGIPARQLVQSVITRWGTQTKMLESLLENQQTLTTFELEMSASATAAQQVTFSTLHRPRFWTLLDVIVGFLKPTSSIQTSSESDAYYAFYVVANWAAILRRLRSVGSFVG
jgi:BED zinc finger